MAKIIIIQFSNDIFLQKTNFGGGQFFFGFLTNTDPRLLHAVLSQPYITRRIITIRGTSRTGCSLGPLLGHL